MRVHLGRRALLGAAGCVFAMSAAKGAGVTPIFGAGSSFIDPVMRRWVALVPGALGVQPSYDPVGSGNGRNKILAGDVDFGAFDEPMAADKLANGGLVQFPLVFGGIVCAVNLPGLAVNRLRLTGTLLGGIYAGAIKKWNDPKIVAVNPGVALPDVDIHPVSQGTPNGPMPGTTFNFTQYLLATNQDWRDKHGPAITKRWAVGSMVASNAFMVETLKVLPGAIGYMSFGEAAKARVTTVAMMNKAGQTVDATAAALAAATEQADWAKSPDLVVNLLDLPGERSWPIVIATYALLPREPKKNAEALQSLFRFIIDEPTAATQNFAAPMPAAVRIAVRAMLGITTG